MAVNHRVKMTVSTSSRLLKAVPATGQSSPVAPPEGRLQERALLREWKPLAMGASGA